MTIRRFGQVLRLLQRLLRRCHSYSRSSHLFAYEKFREKLSAKTSHAWDQLTSLSKTEQSEGEQSKFANMLASEDGYEIDQYPQSLDIFLVGCIVAVGGLLTSAPLAILNEYLLSDGDPVSKLESGLRCLFFCEKDGYHAFRAYLAYATVNALFNISLLTVTARGSALLAFLCLKLVVPLTALLSPLDWPVIGSKPVSGEQWCILAVMMFGVCCFRYFALQRIDAGVNKCCYPLAFRSAQDQRAEEPLLKD